MKQKIVKFFSSGTIGAKENGDLAEIVAKLVQDGWRVDQIVPLNFRHSSTKDSLEVMSGALLCSKI